jgi:ribosomal protein S5
LKPETATERALRNAYANLITIERYQNRTIMYPVTHRHCRTIVIMRPLAVPTPVH